MKYEKERVSMLETVISRMQNEVFGSQEALMRAVLEVLCCTKSHDFKYAWNKETFGTETGLLKKMGLERSYMGHIVRRKEEDK